MNNWNENENSVVNNNSFVFYESFYSSMDGLSAAQKEELIWVMCNYAFYEKIGKMSSEIQRMFDANTGVVTETDSQLELEC